MTTSEVSAGDLTAMDEKGVCTFSYTSFLTSEYELLHSILSCLPMKDLNRAARVCSLWKDVVRVVKRERFSLHWFHWHACGLENNVTKTVDLEVSGANSLWRRKKKPRFTRLEPSSSLSFPPLRKFISEQLSNAYSEPCLVLSFCSTTFLNNQKRFMKFTSEEERDAKSDKNSAVSYFISELPASCTLLGLGSSGVVGTDANLLYSLEVENNESFSVLLLPRFPGVTFKHFVIESDDRRIHTTQDSLSSETLYSLTGISAEEEVKGLLLFCNIVLEDMGEVGARLIASTLLKRQKRKIAIGGGYVDSFLPIPGFNCNFNIPTTVGLAISGASVQAASVIIKPTVRNPVKVEKIIQKLKQCGLPEENSFAFMFACVARGEGMYRGPNVESEIFRRYFPMTPLFGFFGNGEIGIEHLPKNSENEGENVDARFSFRTEQKKEERIPDLFHGFTTVIMLITLGKKQESKKAKEKCNY